MEASLVQAQLIAYDSKWIQTVEVPTHVESSENSFVVSQNVMRGVWLFLCSFGVKV